MRWTISTLLTLALATPALAGPGGPGGYGPGMRHGGPGGPGGARGHGAMFDPETIEERIGARTERVAELLDLTADQRAAFDRLRADGLASARQKLERMRTLGEEMHALLDSGSTDAAAVGAKMIAMHQMRSELRDTHKAFDQGFSELLTDEQRFAYNALKEARRFGGPGGPDGPGGMHRGPGFGPRHGRPVEPEG